MADGFGLSMVWRPTVAAMGDMSKRTDRATMWALREAGRQVKRQARRRAPVYKGTSGARAQLSHAQFRRFQKATGYKGSVSNNVIISGLLKNSISSSKRLKSIKTGEYALTVTPRGQRVHLYMKKIEATQPYMQPALDAVAPQVTTIHAKAWERAMR